MGGCQVLEAAANPEGHKRSYLQMLRYRYEFGTRWGTMLADKCLAYTSCSQVYSTDGTHH